MSRLPSTPSTPFPLVQPPPRTPSITRRRSTNTNSTPSRSSPSSSPLVNSSNSGRAARVTDRVAANRTSTPSRGPQTLQVAKRIRQPSTESVPPTSPIKRSRGRVTPSSPSPRTTPGQQLFPPSGSDRSVRSLQPSRVALAPKFSTVTNRSAPTPRSPGDMAFLSSLQPNYLQAKIEIVYDQQGLVDMVGPPVLGSSYSLPGHVLLTIPALPSSIEAKVREIKSLIIRMEGKAEYHDEDGRYSPMRLYSANLILANPGKSILVPAMDPSSPSSSTLKLAIPFDLRLPGWLPPSAITAFTNTSYGAKVDARIGWPEGSPVSNAFRRIYLKNGSLNPMTSVRSYSKFTTFKVRRHAIQSTLEGKPIPPADIAYFAGHSATSKSPVEFSVIVPDWIDVNGSEKSFRLSIVIRTKRKYRIPVKAESNANEDVQLVEGDQGPEAGNSVVPPEAGTNVERAPALAGGEHGRPKSGRTVLPSFKVHINELGMSVEESEKFSSFPIPGYDLYYPISQNQPSPNSSQHALISPRPQYAESNGIDKTLNQTRHKISRTRSCLLGDDGKQRTYVFEKEGLELNQYDRRINVVLPMPDVKKQGFQKAGRPQVAHDGPFHTIKQHLNIRLVCNVDVGPTPIRHTVCIKAPIRFGSCLSTVPSPGPRLNLPPYNQIFHDNGELRVCDPLPLYASSEEVSEDESAEGSQDSDLCSSLSSASSSRSPSPSLASTSSSLRSLTPSSAPSETDTMDIDPPSYSYSCKHILETPKRRVRAMFTTTV